MKLGIYLLMSLFSLQSMASAITLEQLIGTLEFKPKEQITYLEKGMSIEYQLAISDQKDEFGHHIIGLNEYIRQSIPESKSQVTISKLECSGVAHMSDEKVMTVNVACENNNSFEQKINLSSVKNPKATTFEAPLFSSMYGVEMAMVVNKISKK
ncbi:MAG: hypothetical protein CME62_15700 [Halobacteriovoraceae bacterium]|nr:hypothetical protein [Halobacteriovoraceae bacterium]|tara:strand:+ start:9390 stop:9851 length:462 start_codon:yes stop_codon:yes gene_type:complete